MVLAPEERGATGCCVIYLDSPKGLGDAIYVRAIVLHCLERDRVTVFTPWPDVFDDLPITTEARRTGNEDIRHCSACLHCRLPEVQPESIFAMACRQAGIQEPVELKMNWKVRNPDVLAKIRRRAGDRQILMYQPPKRETGTQQDLSRPDSAAFTDYLRTRNAYRIKVGSASVQEIPAAPCELDLFGKTSIHDVFDLGTIADSFFGEPSYIGIMAQAMNKPHTCMFSSRAAWANDSRIRNMTPQRFFHKPELGTAVYDC